MAGMISRKFNPVPLRESILSLAAPGIAIITPVFHRSPARPRLGPVLRLVRLSIVFLPLESAFRAHAVHPLKYTSVISEA